MSKRKIDDRELLGYGMVTGRDLTGNEENVPADVRPNTLRPGRTETLDRFDGSGHVFGDDSLPDFSPDEDDDVLGEETDEASFAGSQLDPLEECPSTKDVGRLTAQGKK